MNCKFHPNKKAHLNEMCHGCYARWYRKTESGKASMNKYNKSEAAKAARKKYYDKKIKPNKKPRIKAATTCECGSPSHSKGMCRRCYMRNYQRNRANVNKTHNDTSDLRSKYTDSDINELYLYAKRIMLCCRVPLSRVFKKRGAADWVLRRRLSVENYRELQWISACMSAGYRAGGNRPIPINIGERVEYLLLPEYESSQYINKEQLP